MAAADTESRSRGAPYVAAAAVALGLLAFAVAWAARTGCPVTKPASGDRGGKADLPVARVDVNSADEAGLRALPGIGRTFARRIVAERGRGGPFAGPDELLRVRGVTRELVDRIRPYVEFASGGDGTEGERK